MATRVRSFSKINLGLAIGPPREDGFHGLMTLYQTLALHDVVTVEAHLLESGPSVITLTTNHPRVPLDSRNTAWKIVEGALTRMGVAADVRIHIEKELPIQGGLGAGSANAAAALIGLEHELGFTLSELARFEVAAEVGSDVPLFLLGGAVLGTERGERVREMHDLPRTWCVVAVPEIGVSTPRAFHDWDSLCTEAGDRAQGTGKSSGAATGLTSPPEPDRLEKLSHAYASVFGVSLLTEQAPDTSGIVRYGQDSINSETKRGGLEETSFTSKQGIVRHDLAGNTLLALVRTGIENDFEQVVFPQYPFLREIKRILMGIPADEAQIGVLANPVRPDDLSSKALYAALSGSGSALFGLYESETEAKAAQQRVQASGCKAILTETLPRAEYWSTMFAE